MNSPSSYLAISERKLLLRVVDVLLIVSSFWFANSLGSFDYFDFNNPAIFSWIITLFVEILFIGEVFKLYDLAVSSSRFKIVQSSVITFIAVTVVYIFTPIIAPSLPENRLQIIYFFLLMFFPVLAWRFLYISLFSSPRYFKNIIVIGAANRISVLLQEIENKKFHNVLACVSDAQLNTTLEHHDIARTDVYALVMKKNVKEIIVTTSGIDVENAIRIQKQLILLFEKGINIKSFETFYEEITDRIPRALLNAQFYKHISFSEISNKKLYQFFSRLSDILFSLIGFTLFVGLFPFVVIGNLLGNRGAMFYTQQRVGKNGTLFKIVKLRSMVVNAEKDGAVWAQKNDVRITRFGKFLRRTRIDEIPQFYNILKGDMSLIGPRPERPEFIKDLEHKIPFYAIRNVAKPGLTGWAQVNYPYANTIEEQEIKLRYDLFYIKRRDAFLDFKIIIKTITTVLFFKGQ